MFYVYILKSIVNPKKMYVGLTPDLERRVSEHNSGKSKYTFSFRPWKVHCYFAFEDKDRAVTFEQYLKSHTGRAFISKRIW